MSNDSSQKRCALEIRQGRPVFVFNGQPISQAIASDPVVWIKPLAHSKPEMWIERCRLFRESGVHNYSINPVHWTTDGRNNRFWVGEGQYITPDPNDAEYGIEKQAAALLEIDPDARLWVRFGDTVPPAWVAANPDEIQRNYSGEERPWFSPQPSLASEKGLADLCTFVQHFLRFCEAQPWAERLFLYSYCPGGEGIPNLNVSGMVFDTCPAMQRAYRDYLMRAYGEEASLRQAWGDPEVSFETLRVPTDAEWRADLAQVEHWPRPDQLTRYRDYFHLMRGLFLRWYRGIIGATQETIQGVVPFGIDMCKQHMLGWQHNLFFSGIGPVAEFLDVFSAGGSIDVGELLDDPGLDLLWTPADYTARSVGYGWEAEGMNDSMLLRGKTLIIENDSRTFSPTGGEHTTQGAFDTVEEVRAGLLRNAAWCLTRAGMDEWGLGGGSYFDNPLVQEHGIVPCTRLLDLAPSIPHRETEHAIAMIVDDTAPWLEDGTSGYENLACIWQRVLGLSHCGIPYRIYLLSDLEKENMPAYGAYYFPNLFEMNEQRLELLQRQVLADGRLAIFGPATGISSGKELSAEWATRLLGVEMEMVPDKQALRRVILQGPHPIAQALPASLTYGEGLGYGPILIPAKGAVESAGAQRLGWATGYWQVNRPGLFVNNRGTHKVAWTSALPMPAGLLRELARWGGCHVWCEEDDVVYASDTVAAIHTVKAGPRRLALPTARPVWDLLSGEKLGESLSAIDLELATPETRVFYFGEEWPG